MTDLCVPIFVMDAAQARRDMLLAAEAGADLVELRVDTVTEVDDAVAALVLQAPVPCIVTCRPDSEGGHSMLPDEQRAKLLNELSIGRTRYVDVELETLRRGRYDVVFRAPLIVSSHDFKGRPPRLGNIVLEMNRTPAATVAKIVWMARSIRDNLEVFELLRDRSKSTIALCMGEAGLISRVLSKKFGAFLAFASLREEIATAPGQVTVDDMKRLYRWDALNANTKVYGVVASPVMHSMSPAIHNAGFAEVSHDGVYLPLLVNPGYESFKAFMESFVAFEPLHLRGLSVTLPHKENALRYLKEKGAQVEELAERIGAVNTIVIDPAARLPLRGFNTDYAAILDTITTTLNITREQLSDLRVAVIGAGGTGRTAVAALAEVGSTVVVYNRTKERADALAAEFDGKIGKVVSARMEKLCDSCCHVFINATSVGMHPRVDESPVGEGAPPKFSPDTLVFDTIYNPMETKLLRQAKEAGAKTVGGVEMFVRQAARQFQAWTGKPAPLDVFRRVVESRLTSR